MIELHGITWDHPRGHAPLAATAAAYMRDHSDVAIHWDRRSLQAFADYPIARLAARYDLIVIDHPHVGAAAAQGCLAPLDRYLSAELLADQEMGSVGPSNPSYIYAGHQWALAIDAAAQVAAYRPDLLERIGADVPRTWDDVLALARVLRGDGRGRVAVPLIPVDTLMCFCTLCANAGEDPFADPDRVVGRPVGRYALGLLRALREACHPASMGWNPPALLDRMGETDEIVYCPLAFGYVSYARPGFRRRTVRFANIPGRGGGGPRGAILGGTGLAVSACARRLDVACDYAAYVASADVQRGAYVDAGGQPGHRAAWIDARVNAATGNFFVGTLDTLDRAYTRPCYDGYMAVQEGVALALHAFLREGGDPDAVLATLDDIHRTGRRAERDGTAKGDNGTRARGSPSPPDDDAPMR